MQSEILEIGTKLEFQRIKIRKVTQTKERAWEKVQKTLHRLEVLKDV